MSERSVSTLTSVTKSYPSFKLGPISLNFEKGKITAIVGPNGAGKTTTLYLLLGIKNPDGGEVISPPLNKSSIVGIGKLPLLFTAIEVAKLYKNRIDFKEFEKNLKEFKLPLKQEIGKLSSGQKLLVEWSIALSLKSEIILLDEPFNNVDVIFRNILYKKLDKYIKKYNVPCVVTSHNLLEIDSISDEIIFLNDGKICEHFKKSEKKVNYFVLDSEKHEIKSLITTKTYKNIIALPRGKVVENVKQIDLIDIFKIIFENEGDYE